MFTLHTWKLFNLLSTQWMLRECNLELVLLTVHQELNKLTTLKVRSLKLPSTRDLVGCEGEVGREQVSQKVSVLSFDSANSLCSTPPSPSTLLPLGPSIYDVHMKGDVQNMVIVRTL